MKVDLESLQRNLAYLVDRNIISDVPARIIQLSIAHSLERIADALENNAELLSAINNAGLNAGRR
ncbi:MAG: hypothetical protein Q7O66_14955 [Dehalococcoidia bacterium]|nr:hypothetical protein [Dehalococcoidia bacterium]